MANAYVNVTEGSGKKLAAFDRTVGADTVLQQIVLLGEPHYASYLVTASAAPCNNAYPVFQLMAGASLNVYVDRIEIWQKAMATTVTVTDYAVYRLSSAGTGGTPVTPLPLDTTDAASGATCTVLPTTSGTAAASAIHRASAYMMQTLAASAAMIQPTYSVDFGRLRSKGLRIPAGATNGIEVVSGGAIAGATINIDVWFHEASY